MVNELKFRFLKEVKDQTTGKSTWQSVATSPAINAEEVSVTTQAEKLVIAEGKDPIIIPYGVKGEGGRVAQFVGTFKGRSMEGPLMDEYFDVLQDDVQLLGYAISVTGTGGTSILPELGTRKWRIEQFSWDRQARLMGQWKFNITLGYIWENPAELKLYSSGIGTNQPTNVKFRVTKGIGTSSYSSGTPVFGVKIESEEEDLNRAKFKTITQEFDKDDIIRIYCETDKSKSCFFGVVVEPVKNSDGTVLYNCVEIGTLLQRIQCAKVTAGLFKPRIKIPNPRKGEFLKLNQLIGIILKIYADNKIREYDPGLGADKSSGWGEKDVIPGTEQKLPGQLLSGMNILSALDNLVIKQCGMRTWFDRNTGKLEYGFVRNSITIDPTKEYIKNTVKESSQSNDFNADFVIVYDANNQRAQSVDGDLTGKTSVAYKIDSVVQDMQLKAMAQRIQKEIQLNNDMFSVTFPAGVVRFQEGDMFAGLGDDTVNPKMSWRGGIENTPLSDPTDTVWKIKKVTITDSYTECLVGSSFYSVFDIYRNSLKRIAEAPVSTESKDVETDEIVAHPQETIEE